MAQVSYENWATQTSIERLSALTSRPLFLSWVVVVSVCSPPCPWYTPHSVGPSLCPELRDVIPMCLQRPYHPAKVLHLVHPSSSPQSSLVLIIKAINPPSVPLNLPPSLLRHSSTMTPRNDTCFTPVHISLSGFHSLPLPALTRRMCSSFKARSGKQHRDGASSSFPGSVTHSTKYCIRKSCFGQMEERRERV